MNTDAVMCIALTSTRPSLTPLLRTAASTFGVMFSKPTRAGMLKVRYSVCDFIWPENTPRIRWLASARVVVRGGKALIIKRAHEPRKGEWSLPGGLLELGESLQDAVRREIKEETSLDVEVGPIIETFDRVHRDDDGRIRYHFVIVDFVCWPDERRRRGRLRRRRRRLGHAPRRSTTMRVNAHAKAVILQRP